MEGIQAHVLREATPVTYRTSSSSSVYRHASQKNSNAELSSWSSLARTFSRRAGSGAGEEEGKGWAHLPCKGGEEEGMSFLRVTTETVCQEACLNPAPFSPPTSSPVRASPSSVGVLAPMDGDVGCATNACIEGLNPSCSPGWTGEAEEDDKGSLAPRGAKGSAGTGRGNVLLKYERSYQLLQVLPWNSQVLSSSTLVPSFLRRLFHPLP